VICLAGNRAMASLIRGMGFILERAGGPASPQAQKKSTWFDTQGC
jgi:hypothetical protein